SCAARRSGLLPDSFLPGCCLRSVSRHGSGAPRPCRGRSATRGTETEDVARVWIVRSLRVHLAFRFGVQPSGCPLSLAFDQAKASTPNVTLSVIHLEFAGCRPSGAAVQAKA